MIRFYSQSLTVPTSFNMCRTSGPAGVSVLYGVENQIHGMHLSPDALVSSFQASLNSSPNGIIVDENIDIGYGNSRYSKLVVQALNKLNKNGKLIGVWHSARLSLDFAKLYKESQVDYVFLESYWPWTSNFMLWLFFELNYFNAKKAGMLSKYIPVLGEDFGNSFDLNDPWQIIPWCNTQKILDKQLSYIKDKMKGIAGVGFYVLNSITDSFFSTVDKEIARLFPDNY